MNFQRLKYLFTFIKQKEKFENVKKMLKESKYFSSAS